MSLRLCQPAADSLTAATSAGIIKMSSAGQRTGVIDLRQRRDMLGFTHTLGHVHTLLRLNRKMYRKEEKVLYVQVYAKEDIYIMHHYVCIIQRVHHLKRASFKECLWSGNVHIRRLCLFLISQLI